MKELIISRKNLTNNTSVIDNGVMSAEEFREALPTKLHNRVSVSIMSSVNEILANPYIRDHFRENLVSFTSVITGGKFKLASYVDAVKYVSFKMLGHTNQECYTKTFPGRVTQLLSEGATEKKISSYVSMYNGNKLVNAIVEQTLIPSYVLNADIYQKAINTQAELMLGASSETVRCNAADSLLNHLKPPEVNKVELDIGIKDNDSIAELKRITTEYAEAQQNAIKAGNLTPIQVAHSELNIKAEDVTDVELNE